MKRILALVAAFVLAGAAHALAVGPFAVTTKDTKPTLGAARAVRTVFDCTGLDTLQLTVFQTDSLTGNLSGGPTALDGYGCTPWPEYGPENVHLLRVTQELELWAGLVDRDPAVDQDLFLLDGCDTDACLVGANTELTAILPAGDYYLVVDGYGTSDSSGVGPYTVLVETRPLGLPDEACLTAQPEACTVGGEIPLTGNLFYQDNLMQAYPCNASQARAGDAWFALDLLPGQSFTARTSAVAPDLDLVLWLFAGCAPEPVCLAAADDSLAGQLEELTWRSDVAETLTVYLGVDAVRAPADSADGTWSMSIDCSTSVPAEEESFGGLKALYR